MKLPDNFNEASKHSFCVLPWVHRFINLGGEVQLCCTAEEHPHSYIRDDSGKLFNAKDGLSDAQIGASRHMCEIRQLMLQGEWPAACQRCEVTEQTGGISRRSSENRHFKAHIPWILENTDQHGNTPAQIRSRDYRLGNRCNLRCRMCHPRASSLLLDEWNQISRPRLRINPAKARSLNQRAWLQDQQLWHDFSANVHALEHLHFAGGEPLVMPKVLKAMEICVATGAAQQIELTFNTNLTKIPARHRELWPHFKVVNLVCSIDAHGTLNDYIRFPSNWNTIARNLDTIEREHEALNLGCAHISATVQIYNIFHLCALVEYSHQQFSFIRPMPSLIHLALPDYFNIQFLPNDLKQLAAKQLQGLVTRLRATGVHEGFEQIEAIITYMQSANHSPYLMSEFRRITTTFDRLRSESLTRLVPELAPLMSTKNSTGLRWQVAVATSQGKWLAGKLAGKLKNQLAH